jgi:hypothetical protein
MTEYEYADIYGIAWQNGTTTLLSLITVVFAYLVVAHFAAKKLEKVVAIGLSTIYSLFVVSNLSAYGTASLQLYTISERYQLAYPGGWVIQEISTDRFGFLVIATTPVILCWLGSLVYLHRFVRK